MRADSLQEIVEKTISPKLHVLTLTPFFPSDGDEVSGCFVAESIRQIETQGVTSTVIAVDSIYHPSRKPNPQNPAQWIRYPQLPGNFGLSTAGRFLGAALLNRVRGLNRRSPVTVIHAHAALPCGHAAAFLSRRLNIPFVVTIHGLDVFNRCFEDGLAARWRRKSSLAAYRSARKVICISQKVQGVLQQGTGSDISSEVVYNGTNAEFFSPAPVRTGPPTILVVGTILAGKGHELVLRAVAQLKASHPDLQCTIMGEGGDQNRFASLARDLQIDDRIHFVGRRSRAEVAAAMRECTVFVLPSRYEGLGCVYLEAMASGKPAIGCVGQGIDEIIHDGLNGGLIPVDGLDELVQKLQRWLADVELRLRIGHFARRTILEGLTLRQQAQHLIKIYEEVTL